MFEQQMIREVSTSLAKRVNEAVRPPAENMPLLVMDSIQWNIVGFK